MHETQNVTLDFNFRRADSTKAYASLIHAPGMLHFSPEKAWLESNADREMEAH